MSHHKKSLFYSIIVFLAGLLIATSCAPTRKAAYFRIHEEIKDMDQPDQSYETEQDSVYVIKPGDELYITVSTADNEPNNFTQTTGTGVSMYLDLLSYVIDPDGFVKLPYLGKIRLSDLSIDEATNRMEAELSQYLYQPVVSIKLVNIRVTVLGEVGSPGMFAVNNRSVNIYQALGYAGDITEFGNRRKVLIVRETGDMVIKKYVDLTNDAILGSDWYMVRPNDVIYVEPLARRQLGIATFPWTLISSVISTTILIMTFMITLQN